MQKRKSLKTKIKSLQVSCWCAFLASPVTSHATTIQSILDKSADFLSGSLARSVGIMVLIGSGYLCLVRHKFPKEQLAMILIGLGIIFGGSSLYNSLIG